MVTGRDVSCFSPVWSKHVSNVGVEDTDFGPRRGVVGDELVMTIGHLVGVVGLVGLKDDHESDIEVAVVDLAVVGSARADGKRGDARMAGEVGAAAGDEGLSRGR